MGNSSSAFTAAELDLYQDLTYFTKKEILHAFNRFLNVVPDDETRRDIAARKAEAAVPLDNVASLDELRVNPFGRRLCAVFSSRPDGALTFEDFLDMMSVMSDRAPKSLKAEYAFRVYDLDGDDVIGPADIAGVVELLLGAENRLSAEETRVVVKNVVDEADLDDDRKLSFAEFEHVVSKAPDFLTSFRIRL